MPFPGNEVFIRDFIANEQPLAILKIGSFVLKDKSINTPGPRPVKKKQDAKKYEHKEMLVFIPESPMPNKKNDV